MNFVIPSEVENTSGRGRRRVDCIARLGNGRAHREIASQISHRIQDNAKRCLDFARHATTE
jgi:hypothetical protein